MSKQFLYLILGSDIIHGDWETGISVLASKSGAQKYFSIFLFSVVFPQKIC